MSLHPNEPAPSTAAYFAAINATVVSSIRLLSRALWLRQPLRSLTSRIARGEPPPQRTCPFDGRLLRGHQRNRRVEHPVAEAPFVVIPAGDFDEAARDLGQRGVEDRR